MTWQEKRQRMDHVPPQVPSDSERARRLECQLNKLIFPECF